LRHLSLLRLTSSCTYVRLPSGLPRAGWTRISASAWASCPRCAGVPTR